MNISCVNGNIERLDENNYEIWKIQIKSVLIYNELWNYVSGNNKKPTEEDKKQEWENKDAKALAIILLSVKENQLSHVKKCKTSQEAWKTLENIHSSKGPSRKVMLYKQLFQLRKSHDQHMNEHVQEFQQKVDQLEETGINIPKELLSIMLLNSLPEEYESFCIAMETRDDLPSLDVLKVKLLEEDHRRTNQNNEVNYQNALLSNEGLERSRNKENGRSEANNRESKHYVKRQIHNHFGGSCFLCGKKGHMARECTSKKKNQHNHQKTKQSAAMTAVLSVSANEIELSKTMWCLDSGASSHMCNNYNKFIKWHNKNRSVI